MKIDKAGAEKAISELLRCLCIDVQSARHSDMKTTPSRAAKMLIELWRGEWVTNDEIAARYGKTFEHGGNELLLVKDITCFSHCEHHLALMYNMHISVAYYPHGRVIGLSKISRIADLCCRRLQLQERIGSDILQVMQKIVGPDVCVVIDAEHSCVTARGVQKPGTSTRTISAGGRFTAPDERTALLGLIM